MGKVGVVAPTLWSGCDPLAVPTTPLPINTPEARGRVRYKSDVTGAGLAFSASNKSIDPQDENATANVNHCHSRHRHRSSMNSNNLQHFAMPAPRPVPTPMPAPKTHSPLLSFAAASCPATPVKTKAKCPRKPPNSARVRRDRQRSRSPIPMARRTRNLFRDKEVQSYRQRMSEMHLRKNNSKIIRNMMRGQHREREASSMVNLRKACGLKSPSSNCEAQYVNEEMQTSCPYALECEELTGVVDLTYGSKNVTECVKMPRQQSSVSVKEKKNLLFKFHTGNNTINRKKIHRTASAPACSFSPTRDLATPFVKCVIVGDEYVGKTSLLLSHYAGGFSWEHIPTVIDRTSMNVRLDDTVIDTDVWDTSARKDNRSIRTLTYPNTDVFLVCFSVDRPETFENARDIWIPEVRGICPKAAVILVGCKGDKRDPRVRNTGKYALRPFVTREEALDAAEELNARYIETSSYEQSGVGEMFRLAMRVGVEYKEHRGLFSTPQKRNSWKIVRKVFKKSFMTMMSSSDSKVSREGNNPGSRRNSSIVMQSAQNRQHSRHNSTNSLFKGSGSRRRRPSDEELKKMQSAKQCCVIA